MKLLIVCSGNNGLSPIIKSQTDSLKNNGVDLDFFLIKGKGIWGYIKNIPKLRKILKSQTYDLIHAHYSLSAFVASLAGAKPLVVSLMGSDVESSKTWHFLLKIFDAIFWNATIVKSKRMKEKLDIDAYVIPNGVNFKKFYPIDKSKAQEKVNFDKEKKHILFLADPKRKEKNYKLAKEAFDELKIKNIELNVIYGISHDDIPFYLNASDVLLMTSLWEGSPNVIKEAMACNIPIVATDVGDIKEVIGQTEGCFITSFDKKDVANKLSQAINFNKRTKGREKIDFLEENKIAQKLIKIYNNIRGDR